MPLSGVCIMHPTSIYRQDAAQLHGVYAPGCPSPALARDDYPITMPDTPGKFRDAGREQESFFAPVEKRLLVRMAHATPRSINSDHLTLLGFVSMFFAGLCYWLARWNKYMETKPSRVRWSEL